MTVARHCIVQKHITYYMTRINSGQHEFFPGDDIFVLPADFPKMKRQKKVKAVEDVEREVITREVDFHDTFPRTGPKVWVFGDGPTAKVGKEQIKDGDIVFAVNRCFFQPLDLVPDYYVALDDGTMIMEEKQIKELKAVRKFTKRGNAVSGKWEWEELRFFDVRGELGFSQETLEVYHGKTTAFIALQLATQSIREYIATREAEIHLSGIDLAVMKVSENQILSHHYGHSAYDEIIFTRMLSSIRYGLSYLNEIGVKWVNHSDLLRSRIEDLVVQNGDR